MDVGVEGGDRQIEYVWLYKKKGEIRNRRDLIAKVPVGGVTHERPSLKQDFEWNEGVADVSWLRV